MGWNSRQQAAIDHRGENLLVAAAAGSGKTAVLVERVTQLILGGEASIDEMLVVTFTKKAAAGMKEKIVQSLQKRIAEDGQAGNLESVERLKHQLSLMPEASISTFDAFNQKVVRENFQAAGVDPGVRICDENKAVLYSHQALDMLLNEKLGEAAPDFIAFMDAYADLKSLESIKKLIADFYTRIRALDNPFEFFEAAVERLNMDEDELLSSEAMKTFAAVVKTRLSVDFNALKAQAMDLVSDPIFKHQKAKLIEDLGPYEKLKEQIEAFMDDYESKSIKDGAELAKRFDLIVETASSIKDARILKTKECEQEWPKIKDELKDARDAYKAPFKTLVKDYFNQSLHDAINEINQTYTHAKTFLGLVKGYEEKLNAIKEEKCVLDFSDFAHLALKILKVSPQYKEKYKFIFVDEYQDSNELQEALISNLSNGDNVFMVGDVKQSIYRFRHAEPSLFQGKYSGYKSGAEPGRVIDLNCNYRSKQSVIDVTNELFRNVMEGYDTDAELKKGNSYTGPLQYPAKIIIADESVPSKDGLQLSRVELEANLVAKTIREIIASGQLIPYEKDGQFYSRPVEYKDIVVLRPSVKDVSDVFTTVLNSNSIALVAEQADGYFDAVEIEVFINLLSIIDNTRQDIPLISVLFSGIFGFSAQELAEIRTTIKGRGTAFYDAFFHCADPKASAEALGIGQELHIKCVDALNRINGWKDDASLMPLTDLIWQLYRDTGYYIYTGALPGGEQRQTNLRLLAGRAMEYSASGSGIYGFLSEIDAIKKRKLKVPPATTLGEGADAVRLMTIHKSKGLEFPIVIVTGMNKEMLKNSSEESTITFNKRLGLGFTLVDPKGQWQKKTMLSKLIKEQNKIEELNERRRLLYVAFTRAIDQLILCGVVKDYNEHYADWASMRPMNPASSMTAGTYLDLIMPNLAGPYPVSIENIDSIAGPVAPAATAATKSPLTYLDIPEDLAVRSQIKDRLSYEYPYMNELGVKAKYSVTEINQGQSHTPIILRVPETLEPAAARADGLEAEDVLEDRTLALTAAEKGTIYHLVMEHLDFSDLASLSPADVLAGLVQDGQVSQAEADSIHLDKIETFLKSDLAARMSKADGAGKLYREAPFTARTEYEGSTVLVQGIIDCFFEETADDGSTYYVLVDYKSNRVMDQSAETLNHFKEMYVKQIDLYHQAIEKAKGGCVKERYLFLLDAGLAIDL